MPTRPRVTDVFINCPFDSTYKPIFDAIVFAVYSVGFTARCALEVDDASEVRLAKILRIIEQCPYGIHDISSVGLGKTTKLPRFNMPFELGLFLGAKTFGAKAQRNKVSLILDSQPYRYQATISDIAGQDIHVHQSDPAVAIREVRNWLVNVSGTRGLPGGSEIVDRFAHFMGDLPSICRTLKRRPSEQTFGDFAETVEIWLKSAR